VFASNKSAVPRNSSARRCAAWRSTAVEVARRAERVASCRCVGVLRRADHARLIGGIAALVRRPERCSPAIHGTARHVPASRRQLRRERVEHSAIRDVPAARD
jgi:hypothetical protein